MSGFTKRFMVVIGTAVICFALTGTAFAEKLFIAKYRTQEPAGNVFDDTVKAMTVEKYTLRSADKSQGTIQAIKMAWGSGTEYASVFITVHQVGNGTKVEATFTRHPGIVGGGSPHKWAAVFENDLKNSIPDLAAER
jgi:hypothetical protein